VLIQNQPGVGRGIRDPTTGGRDQVSPGHQIRLSRSFDHRETGVSAEDERIVRDLLKGKDPPDALNVGRMVNGILVATAAPQYISLAADLSRLTTTHAAVV